MYNVREGLWENNHQKLDLNWNVSQRGEGEGEWEGGQPGDVFSVYSLHAIVHDSPLRAGIRARFRVPIWTRLETNWESKNAGAMMRWGRLMTSQVWCPAWQLKAQIWWSHVWGWTDGGLENMANGLSACFFTVAFSSARIKAWRPGPSRSDGRQRALTDVSHQSSPGRANGWTCPQLLHTWKSKNF